MPGITTEPLGTGRGVMYLDESGGYVQISVTAKGYISVHKFHVPSFAPTGSGAYSTVPSGGEANVLQTASNLVAQIATLYKSSATIQALGVYQVKSDGTGVLPTAIDVSSAVANGVNSATNDGAVDTYEGYTGHGADFSKWQVHFHATAAAYTDMGFRNTASSYGPGTQLDFQDYITGSAGGIGISGTGTGLKCAVVTKSGYPILAPIYVIYSLSRRIRRRYRFL